MDINEVKYIFKQNNLQAKKRLGQNFLIKEKPLNTIIKTADISKNDHIIEIGPGLGVLTRKLAKAAEKVTTIELDNSLLPILKKKLSEFNNIQIINEDVLKTTPSKNSYKIVANIPYNITSPLINHFLQSKNKPNTMTLLIQKEVAEKICEKNKHSILSLQVQLFGEPKYIAEVKANCFYPQPKVNSAIIHIKTYKSNDAEFISREKAIKILNLAKKAFSQKRKKLSNTLKNSLSLLKKHNLENQRPEDLTIKDWKKLTN